MEMNVLLKSNLKILLEACPCADTSQDFTHSRGGGCSAFTWSPLAHLSDQRATPQATNMFKINGDIWTGADVWYQPLRSHREIARNMRAIWGIRGSVECPGYLKRSPGGRFAQVHTTKNSHGFRKYQPWFHHTLTLEFIVDLAFLVPYL